MTMRGVVRGKMIELDEVPKIAEGQTVEVTLRPVAAPDPASGLRRAAGAWANLPDVDAVVQEIERIRQEARFRDDES